MQERIVFDRIEFSNSGRGTINNWKWVTIIAMGPFFLGRQFVASISRLLEKLETRAIAYSNREKKCVAYKEHFLRRWSKSRVFRRRAI